MDIFQIKHFKDGVGGLAVLPLDDGVPDAHLLGGHIILENGLAVQPNPRISRAGNRNLDVRVGLHILVDVLLVVGAKPLYTQLLCAQWMFSLFRDGKLSNKQVLDTLAQLTPQKRSLQTAYFLSQITFFTRTKHTLDADAREQWEQLYQQLLSLLAADLLHCSEQERNTALFWLYDNEQCSQCSLQLDLSRYIEDSTIRDAVLQKAVEGIQKYLIDSKYERNLKTAVDLYLTSAEQLYGGEVEKQILGKLVDWRTFERAAEPELKNYAYDKWHYAYIRAKWQLFLLAKYAQLHPGAEKTLKWLKEWRTRLPNIANEESGTNLTGS